MIDERLYERNVNYMQTSDNCSQVSDGSHTFEELYEHRSILFAALCNTNLDNAWKSTKHQDGSMFDGYFIAGINIGNQQKQPIRYHIELKYWDLFHCKELDNAPECGGSTPADCLEGLKKLCNVEQFTNEDSIFDY